MLTSLRWCKVVRVLLQHIRRFSNRTGIDSISSIFEPLRNASYQAASSISLHSIRLKSKVFECHPFVLIKILRSFGVEGLNSIRMIFKLVVVYSDGTSARLYGNRKYEIPNRRPEKWRR